MVTLCAECGLNVKVDEDGCCIHCGATAYGQAMEEFGTLYCYFCEKPLSIGKDKGFICICNKCLVLFEKQEARMVAKICAQRQELKDIHEKE